MNLNDPIALFDEVRKLHEDAAALDARFSRITRKLFTTDTGREWLRIALARTNFMGSVFSAEDGMNSANAAYRDGVRSVFSEILNSAAAGMRQPEAPDE